MKRKIVIAALLVFVVSLFLGLNTAWAAEKQVSFEKSFAEALNSSGREIGCTGSLVSVKRKKLVGNIYEYTMILKVGAGEFDQIGVHRVVKEKAPWLPNMPKKAVLMVHGDSNNFASAFLAPTANQSFGVYLAQKGVDVWGIDLRWTFVPDTTTDFSFMKNWDTALHLQDIKLAVKTARTVRSLTGSGFGKIMMLGHSRGAQFVYAYANEETQLPVQRRDLAGIIPVDMIYKFSPENQDLQQAALIRYQAYKYLYDTGVYYSDDAKKMKAMAYLSKTAPDEPSPLIPGFTNKQFGLSVLTATYATYDPLQPPTPFYHYLAGTFDSSMMPTGLQFTNQDNVLNNALTVPGYQSLGEMIDGEAIISNAVETPYDDHLGDIKVPVYYVGAAGGMGEYGVDTLSLLGGADKSSLIVRLYPQEAAALDFGHADLFWADNAQSLVWEPIRRWINKH